MACAARNYNRDPTNDVSLQREEHLALRRTRFLASAAKTNTRLVVYQEDLFYAHWLSTIVVGRRGSRL